MRTIEHTLRIETSPERVWQVLTDTAAYDRWNPFITRLDGSLTPGSNHALRARALALPAG